MKGKRENFGSKIGIIAASAGSAVGLGNIWRFPYITGENGGAIFILLYAFFIMLIGISCMLVEFIIGRMSKKDAIGSFSKLAPKTPWVLGGWIGIITVGIIYSFYSVIFGWSLNYLIKAVMDSFSGKSPGEIATLFKTTSSNTFLPILYTFLGIATTACVIAAGVKKGIEKYTKIFMPLLLLILTILVFRGITLEGSQKGMKFLFEPDISQISGHVVLMALGQAFFGLSLGAGVMITYGSYISKNEKLGSTVAYTCLLNFCISILAAVAIFTIAFANGVSPGQGPGLAFITLPNIFDKLAFGYFFSIMFFLLLTIAALTSTISMLEVIVSCIIQEIKISRKKAAILVSSLIAILSIPSSLSFGLLENFTIFGNTIFDIFNKFSSNFGMVICSLICVLFVGWYLDSAKVKEEISNKGELKAKYYPLFMFVIKYVVPVLILVIFINGIINL